MATAILLALALFTTLVAAQSPVKVECLRCICEAVSGCNRTLGCDANGIICGLLKITKPYWIDADMPVLEGDNPKTSGAFERCVLDAYCAAVTVQKYMKRYEDIADCNEDGKLDCDDYVLAHINSPFACKKVSLEGNVEKRYKSCMSKAQALG